ncbi:D-serine dehydratase [Bacillus thuringiensis serovar israelensis ATCC 35646]|nr:D-serine dehydratase [Bacillus thuringiensis serovar israelensis ATCC 35646]
MFHNNAKVFLETQEASGIIESSLVNINSMKQYLQREYKEAIPGKLLLKCDSHLPIS